MVKLKASKATRYCLFATCLAELAIQIIPIDAHSKTHNFSRAFASFTGEAKHGKIYTKDINSKKHKTGKISLQSRQPRLVL